MTARDVHVDVHLVSLRPAAGIGGEGAAVDRAS